MPPLNRCSKCKAEKEFSCFWKGRYKNGLSNWCKECRRAYQCHPDVKQRVKFYGNRPEVKEMRKRWRDSRTGQNKILKQIFGIDIDEYEMHFLNQGGKCAICGTHQSELKIRLNVDHDHKNGIVRGLLCGNCNRAIGLLKDSCRILASAFNYLDRRYIE
jgi:hypothetical protein